MTPDTGQGDKVGTVAVVTLQSVSTCIMLASDQLVVRIFPENSVVPDDSYALPFSLIRKDEQRRARPGSFLENILAAALGTQFGARTIIIIPMMKNCILQCRCEIGGPTGCDFLEPLGLLVLNLVIAQVTARFRYCFHSTVECFVLNRFFSHCNQPRGCSKELTSVETTWTIPNAFCCSEKILVENCYIFGL